MKYKNIYGNLPNEIAEEAVKIAVARARYRVQEDYNRELIQEIASKTGHENLASTCFVEVDISSKDNLKVDVYTDSDMIEGLHKSNSSFHQDGGKWRSVKRHYGMSRDDFWERKDSGYEDGGSFGTVDTEWLTDNFWNGVYYATNGWPLGNADFLQVYPYNDISADFITSSYHKRYVKSQRFQKYIAEEIAAMS